MATVVASIMSPENVSVPARHTAEKLPDVDYYREQAALGPLIISKTVPINEFGWSQQQVEAWRRVTDAVHEVNSTIYLQLTAFGRSNPPLLTRNMIKASVGRLSRAAESASAAGFDGVDFNVF